MLPAVLLDRDGVLNPNVLNPASGCYEAPSKPEDFALFPGIVEWLAVLQQRGYLLILVSNQPAYAKGTTTKACLQAIHRKMHREFQRQDIAFAAYYYCYHHPNGVVPEYAKSCACRKPGPEFLHRAVREHQADLPRSWIVGDRDTDIDLAGDLGPRTILIRSDLPGAKQGRSRPDYTVEDLGAAVRTILQADHATSTVREAL